MCGLDLRNICVSLTLINQKYLPNAAGNFKIFYSSDYCSAQDHGSHSSPEPFSPHGTRYMHNVSSKNLFRALSPGMVIMDAYQL